MNSLKSIRERTFCVILSALVALSCIAVSGQPLYAASSGTAVTVKIGSTNFDAEFNNSKAAKKLLKKMTFSIKMSELNGNEKYKYLGYKLPTNKKKVKTINAGDIMLYGSDCLVVFYEDLSTTYSYTKIGKITDTSGLKDAVGGGSVKVRFSKTKKTPSLNKKQLELTKGQSFILKLKNAKASKVKWSINDKNVASVKKGKVMAKKPGRAVITAKYRDKKYKCVLNVTDAMTDVIPDPEKQQELSLSVGNRELSIDWEDNDSVAALRELASKGKISISMSMYGGFEQVGSLGTTLPRNDVQMTTEPGDIVLYSGNQIVIFYGSNSWSYTKLGRVKDLNAEELQSLLGNGNVIMTIQ